jgi:hypothetical protein
MSPFLARFAQRRTAYLPVGLTVTGVAATALVLGAGGRYFAAASPQGTFAYAIATGALLIASMLWQWRLSFVRRSRNVATIQRAHRAHRWGGMIPVGLLAVHIGGPGASLLSIMSYCLLVSSLSGIFNNEIVRQKRRLARTIWLWTHVGTAALIVPMILLHVWVVFAFKGP